MKTGVLTDFPARAPASAQRVLVGRERELGVLGDGLAGLGQGKGALVLLAGEAGIGKTSLADVVTEQATAKGHAVLWGRCWEAGGAPAFWPWTELLRSAVELPDVERAAIKRALVQLMPGSSDATPASDPEQARFQLFDEVAGLVRSLSERRPLVLVLDDLHAADRASLLLLRFVARGLRSMPVLIIATYRDVEARLTPEIGEVIAQLGREGQRLVVARLGEADVAALVRAQAAGANVGADVAASVFRVTEGNPLFVDELVRLLRARGGLEQLDVSGRSLLPDGIADAVRTHLGLLDASTRAVLAVAAVFGREVSVKALADVVTTSTGNDALESALAAGISGGVLVRLAGSPRRVRFSHVLIQETLYADLARLERSEIHGRITASLARLPPSLRDAELATIAHHSFESGEIESAVSWARLAATRATAQLAFEAAAALLERAVAVIDEAGHPDERVRCELTLALGENHFGAGDVDKGRDCCRRAATLARALGNAEIEGRAALAFAGGYFAGPGTPADQDRIAMLQDALAVLDKADSPLRARMLARLASALHPTGIEESLERARAAIAMARKLDDRETLLAVLDLSSASDLRSTLAPDERLALDREALALATALGRKVETLAARLRLFCVALERADVAEAEAQLAAHDALLVDFPQPRYRFAGFAAHNGLDVLRGHFERAEAAVDASFRTTARGERPGQTPSDGLRLHMLARTRLDRRTVALLREAVVGKTYVPLHVQVWTLAVAGELDEARRVLERLSPRLETHVNMALSAYAEAVLAVGDRARAEAVYRFLLPMAGHVVVVTRPPAGVTGPIDRVLGDLALFLGDPESAVRHHRAALATCLRMGARPLVARVQHSLACALLASSAAVSGGSAEAAALLEEARATAVALGMDLLVEWIDATRALSSSPTAARATASSTAPRIGLKREGEYWSVTVDDDEPARLKDSKGLAYLAHLLARPGQELHVAQLVALDSADVPGEPMEMGDAGEMIDVDARDAYRARIEHLKDELTEAERFGDSHRAGRAREEMDAIGEQLAGAVGLGGRSRKAASTSERARVNVQRRLKDAIARIAAVSPRAGKVLERTIRTGTYCAFVPIAF